MYLNARIVNQLRENVHMAVQTRNIGENIADNMKQRKVPFLTLKKFSFSFG